ncbi:MAG: hypothetical protein ACYSUV_19575 [Planctomycetota bacterium]|jgi:hypothetical protein
MIKLRWRNLSSEHQQWMKLCGIVNGCGARDGWRAWIRPPSGLFRASCEHHDFNYWLGGREADRLKADAQFLECMLEEIARWPFCLRWAGRVKAWTFYGAVRAFGRPSFSYGHEKTWGDFVNLL